jgi:hypothetical protein
MFSTITHAASRSLRTCSIAFVSILIFSRISIATGPLFYSTAPYLAPPPGGGGSSIYGSQFLGTRFQVTQPITIDAIGGNFQGTTTGGTVWGALVALTSFSDYPNSTNLTTPDVLAHTTFSVPLVSSVDLTLPIGPLTVSPGIYAVVFGGGLAIGGGPFSTNGEAAMPNFAPPNGTPSIFLGQPFQSQTWSETTHAPFSERLTVYATVPEPTTLFLLPLTLLARRRRR